MDITTLLDGSRRLPIHVLTGFLGSGKTTLLKRLLLDGGMYRTAVLVNDFGELGIDHHLIRQVNDRTAVLESGCVCCTISTDLLDTLRELFLLQVRGDAAPVDRVIVETSGVSDPVPVLHTLLSDPFLQERYHMKGLITTLDMTAPLDRLFEREESLRQAALADWICLTKHDLATQDPEDVMRRLAADVNPDARITLNTRRGILALAEAIDDNTVAHANETSDPLSWTTRIGRARSRLRPAAARRFGDLIQRQHTRTLESFIIRSDQAFDWPDIIEWLTVAVQNSANRILRIKGLLHLADRPHQPAVLQGVRQVFHPLSWLDAWPDDTPRTQIVLIVENPERRDRRELLSCIAPAGLPATRRMIIN